MQDESSDNAEGESKRKVPESKITFYEYLMTNVWSGSMNLRDVISTFSRADQTWSTTSSVDFSYFHKEDASSLKSDLLKTLAILQSLPQMTEGEAQNGVSGMITGEKLKVRMDDLSAYEKSAQAALNALGEAYRLRDSFDDISDKDAFLQKHKDDLTREELKKVTNGELLSRIIEDRVKAAEAAARKIQNELRPALTSLKSVRKELVAKKQEELAAKKQEELAAKKQEELAAKKQE